ncbi:hypothetical protein KC232_26460 [Klebsiella variicola]|nr:hypothetical protein [Klebsiella variicola]HEK8471054.1 hypothetical protein [Escherichia coli]HEK8486337.1 hypothetical protein [Escherichia coli]
MSYYLTGQCRKISFTGDGLFIPALFRRSLVNSYAQSPSKNLRIHVAHSNLRSEAVAALANALIAILELIRQFID